MTYINSTELNILKINIYSLRNDKNKILCY